MKRFECQAMMMASGMKTGSSGSHALMVTFFVSCARAIIARAAASRDGSVSMPVTQAPKLRATALAGPPAPTPTISRLAAADRPSGRVSRRVSISPPGKMNPAPQRLSVSASRAAGQAV